MSNDVASLEGRVVAGRYRVVGRLGVGGMGSVWLVQHTESLQRLALKTLHLRASLDRNMVERFLREARAAASLKSRHVVKVVDAQTTYVDPETAYPCPFIVMELLEGCNLEQRMRSSGPMSSGEMLWCFQQAARALDLAHAQGIVHRDLKPKNLFLHQDADNDRETILKVCDFGIAKLSGGAAVGLMDTGAMGTDAQMLFGTPLYMSPEQARSSKNVSPTTDQWAMALIAFRLLTNSEYFAGADTPADLLMKIISDAMIRPSERSPSWPVPLDEWFLRSVAREPTARWPSVGAQAIALAEALPGVKPTAPKFEMRALPASVPPPATVREKGSRVGTGPHATLESGKSEVARPISQPSSFHSGSNPTIEPAAHVDRLRVTVEPSSATNRTARELAAATLRNNDAGLSRGRLAAAAVVMVAILVGSYLLGRKSSEVEGRESKGTASATGATTSTSTTTTATTTTTTATTTAVASATETASTEATIAAPSASTTAIASSSATTTATSKASVTAKGTATAKPKGSASASATIVAPPGKKAAGAPCERSSECASGLCTAFTCR
jgi:serine/threonine protein kinase